MDKQLRSWVSSWHIRMEELVRDKKNRGAWPTILIVYVLDDNWDMDLDAGLQQSMLPTIAIARRAPAKPTSPPDSPPDFPSRLFLAQAFFMLR